VLGELVSDEPVPVAGVIGMDVEGGVDQVGIVPIPLTDTPLVELSRDRLVAHSSNDTKQ